MYLTPIDNLLDISKFNPLLMPDGWLQHFAAPNSSAPMQCQIGLYLIKDKTTLLTCFLQETQRMRLNPEG